MSDKRYHAECETYEQKESKVNAEYAMIFDVISKLPEIHSEEELIRKLLDTFVMLFMPRKIGYHCIGRSINTSNISAENQTLLCSCIENPDHSYVYSTAGNGFLLRLDFKTEVYGVMEIDELAFPEYRDRYLNLMLNVSKICGLAISNARRYEAINESRDALVSINQELQKEIIRRQTAQDELKRLNAELEDEVRKRTIDLLDLNASLEEEIAERQAAQVSLAKLNTELENKVFQRTSQLQEINATLAEEVLERKSAQEALVNSRDALMKSELQLRRFSEELLETNKELTSFANGIAHDFRSPMVNLKGFSRELEASLFELRQLLRDEPERMPVNVRIRFSDVLDREVPESLDLISSSVDRLDRMVNALLGLARIGRRELVLQDVDMAPLVHQVCQSFGHQIGSNNIQLTVGHMPVVKADPLAMERIVSNLVDNGIKYLMHGRPGQISVTCSEEDERYIFCVEDNGRGIAREDYEKIFQVFRRVGQPDIPGDGMGLAYVRTLVRQLGGRVWCESELGLGTKMMFTVPKLQG